MPSRRQRKHARKQQPQAEDGGSSPAIEQSNDLAGFLDIPADADPIEHLYSLGVSDGLPIVPPNAEKCAQMLAASSRDPMQVLGKCPPSYKEVTVRAIAVNAVLAGCRPRHFRCVLAAMEAVLDPKFGLHGVSCTTMGATPCIIINGAVRLQAQANANHGALGSGSRANACIGRAIKLVMQNVGGGKLGGTESTTLGSPMKYTMCLAENEEFLDQIRSEHPETNWLPYPECRGGEEARDEGSVACLAVTSGPHQLVDFYTKDGHKFIDLFAKSLVSAYNTDFGFVNDCLIVLSPEHVQTLASSGIHSKEQFRRLLWNKCNKHMARSVHNLVATQIAGKAVGFKGCLRRVTGKVVGYSIGLLATALNFVSGNGLSAIPKFSSPLSFHVVCCGGPAGKFSCFMPGFGVGLEGMPSANMSSAVIKTVEAPPRHFQQEFSRDYLGASEQRLLDPRCSGEFGAKVAPKQKISSLSPRTGTISGTIGLMDISKTGGSIFLSRMQQLLSADYPQLSFRKYCKRTFSAPASRSLLTEMSASCQFVIGALAD